MSDADYPRFGSYKAMGGQARRRVLGSQGARGSAFDGWNPKLAATADTKFSSGGLWSAAADTTFLDDILKQVAILCRPTIQGRARRGCPRKCGPS
jgi:hypothetical protein